MIQDPDLNQLIEFWRQGAALDTDHISWSKFQNSSLPITNQVMTYSGDRILISIKPTPFFIRTQDSQFYALSALDCLQLPLHLKETIQVETNCPAGNTIIRLTITQEGIETYEPLDCVLSIPIPNPQKTTSVEHTYKMLTRMRFLSSARAASLWLVAYRDVTILDMGEAWKLAQAVYKQKHQRHAPQVGTIKS